MDGPTFMGELRGWRGRRGGGGSGWATQGTGIIRAEPVDDAPLLKIVGGHLDFHAVTGKDPDFVHPHAPGQVAQELVIFRFVGGDADPERRIGITLFYDADEFDDILGQKKSG